MIKLLLKHTIADHCIDTFFNKVITNFYPIPTQNGILEINIHGTKKWQLNGKYHRDDGPAIEFTNGTKSWWLNGKRHRVDGPAVEMHDGYVYWYLNDIEYDESEYWRKVND